MVALLFTVHPFTGDRKQVRGLVRMDVLCPVQSPLGILIPGLDGARPSESGTN